jgi:hypothetical protein
MSLYGTITLYGRSPQPRRSAEHHLQVEKGRRTRDCIVAMAVKYHCHWAETGAPAHLSGAMTYTSANAAVNMPPSFQDNVTNLDSLEERSAQLAGFGLDVLHSRTS